MDTETRSEKKRDNNTIIVYSTPICGYCTLAKQLLDRCELAYTEIDLSDKPDLWTNLMKKHQWRTVPMVIINEHFVGGFQELAELQRSDKLAELLSANQ